LCTAEFAHTHMDPYTLIVFPFPAAAPPPPYPRPLPFHPLHHHRIYPVPFYLMINTAIGGPWPAPPNASSVFPTYHVVDYVKVSTLNA
jgi:hypothetical protein